MSRSKSPHVKVPSGQSPLAKSVLGRLTRISTMRTCRAAEVIENGVAGWLVGVEDRTARSDLMREILENRPKTEITPEGDRPRGTVGLGRLLELACVE